MVVEVKFKIDTKLIKKALALIDEDVPPDEVIAEKLSYRIVDLTTPCNEDGKQAALAIALMAISSGCLKQ